MTYSPIYWNNTAPDMNTYNRLYKHFVPDTGDASTDEGELLNSISTFTYDQYNNGHCNFEGKLNRYKDMISLLNSLKVKLDDESKEAVAFIQTLISRFENMSTMYDEVDRFATCDYCDGDGEVPADWPTDDGMSEMDTCPECEGSGEIYDEGILSEKEEEEIIVNDLFNEFSDTAKWQKALDSLTHCIIVHINDSLNQSFADTFLGKEIDYNIGKDCKPDELDNIEVIAETPSQEFFDYISTLRITEEEFKKASSLFVA